MSTRKYKQWVIYCRKTRNIVSLRRYGRQSSVNRDLKALNGCIRPGQYCKQLQVFDQDDILVKKYPDIELQPCKKS
jgi:hypothetical protein